MMSNIAENESVVNHIKCNGAEAGAEIKCYSLKYLLAMDRDNFFDY